MFEGESDLFEEGGSDLTYQMLLLCQISIQLGIEYGMGLAMWNSLVILPYYLLNLFYSVWYCAGRVPLGSQYLPSLLPNNCTVAPVVAFALGFDREIDL